MNAAYTELSGNAGYRAAVETVITNSDREILIFDRDLIALWREKTPSLLVVEDFLRRGNDQRLRVVVHDPEPRHRLAPRLTALFSRYEALIELRQSPENLRNLCDGHVIGDRNYGVRRFHLDQPRSALIVNDPAYLEPWCQRFEELWSLSEPAPVGRATGL